jgi:TM2 domain-containing membrane protein YozV
MASRRTRRMGVSWVIVGVLILLVGWILSVSGQSGYVAVVLSLIGFFVTTLGALLMLRRTSLAI